MREVIIPLPSPLGDQFGTFPRRSVPAELEDKLFAPGAHVYAIMDAGRIPMFDAETIAENQEFTCLFSGDAVVKLGASAPWLFQLHPDSNLTRRLFSSTTNGWGYWPLRSNVMLRSTEDLGTVRSHFRRFTQIADASGKRYFLRFYCPDTLPVILGMLDGDMGRQQRWFRHRDLDVVESYWIPDMDGCRMIQYRPDPSSHSGESETPFILDNTYRAIMRETRRSQQRRQISHAVLLSEGNARDLPADDWHRIVNDSINAAWRVGVGPERALAYIAMAGLACGRPLATEEISRAMQLPASPGQQTERARNFAESAAQSPSTHYDWQVSR